MVMQWIWHISRTRTNIWKQLKQFVINNKLKIKSIIVNDEKHGSENLAGILRQYCPDVDFQPKTLGGFELKEIIVNDKWKNLI